MSPFSLAALSGLAVVLVAWIAVVLLPQGPARARVAWVGANGLFLALAAWFLRLAFDARADERTWLLVPFAFLAFIFSSGLLVSLWKTASELLGRGPGDASATH
jgi:hypothetical protein